MVPKSMVPISVCKYMLDIQQLHVVEDQSIDGLSLTLQDTMSEPDQINYLKVKRLGYQSIDWAIEHLNTFWNFWSDQAFQCLADKHHNKPLFNNEKCKRLHKKEVDIRFVQLYMNNQLIESATRPGSMQNRFVMNV